jgi:hypothetical protein
MNSRSQTKIRKIQQINLLAEERYLKTKGLLYEGPQEDILKCFTDNGVDQTMIPPSCTETKFDITACSAALPGVIEKIPEEDERNLVIDEGEKNKKRKKITNQKKKKKLPRN